MRYSFAPRASDTGSARITCALDPGDTRRCNGAAVSGAAVAGGMELALWCDLRVMEEDAYFGIYCRRFGVPLIDGGTVRLPRLIGMGHAMDLILTGRKVEPDEALRMGLANRVVPKGRAREAATELALQLSKFPQQTMLADRINALGWGSWEQDRSAPTPTLPRRGGSRRKAQPECEGPGRSVGIGRGRPCSSIAT
jgi:hypothetical protein